MNDPSANKTEADVIKAAILELVAQRGPEKSICPSEAARAVDAADWRRLMPAVRAAAVELAEAGEIAVLRKGKVQNPRDFKGVYRLASPL